MNWTHAGYTLTDHPAQLDFEATCALLASAAWAAQRPRALVEKCLRHSLNFGLFHAGRQVGFARVVTDYTTHAYLCDVILAPEHRGRGVGAWMTQCILNHPALATARLTLLTSAAVGFYRKLGFTPHRDTCLVRYPKDYADGPRSD